MHMVSPFVLTNCTEGVLTHFSGQRYEGVSKSIRTELIKKQTTVTINTCWKARLWRQNSLYRLPKQCHNYIYWQRAVPFAVLAPGGQSGILWYTLVCDGLGHISKIM